MRRSKTRCGRRSARRRRPGAADLPGVAVAQPVVGELDLPAVVNLLVEDAELVADAVADGGNAEGGQGVEVAGGETAEAAVAEAGFALLLDDWSRSRPSSGGLADVVFESEVQQVAGEIRSHEELGREITDDADVVLHVALDGCDPGGEDMVADGVGEGHEVVHVGRGFGALRHDEEEVFKDRLLQGGDAVAGAIVFDGGGLRVECLFLHGAPRSCWVESADLRGFDSGRGGFDSCLTAVWAMLEGAQRADNEIRPHLCRLCGRLTLRSHGGVFTDWGRREGGFGEIFLGLGLRVEVREDQGFDPVPDCGVVFDFDVAVGEGAGDPGVAGGGDVVVFIAEVDVAEDFGGCGVGGVDGGAAVEEALRSGRS